MNDKLFGIIDQLRKDVDREQEAEALYQYVNQTMLNQLTPITTLRYEMTGKNKALTGRAYTLDN